jgi:hypothetical protein
MTVATGVIEASTFFATTRDVMSLVVRIPARVPEGSTIKLAEERFDDSTFVVRRILSSELTMIAFAGRSLETGRSSADSETT